MQQDRRTGWIQLSPGKKHIGAHRGYRACYPENTMAAFNASIGRCDFIELDVQLSRDLVPVVIHDKTLSRTTDIQLSPLHKLFPDAKVLDLNLNELRTLDAGSWFLKSDPFATIRSGKAEKAVLSSIRTQRIPTLKETLNWAEKWHMPLNIELKDMGSKALGEMLVQKVTQLLLDQSVRPPVLLSSFNHRYLRECRRINRSLATAALVEKEHPTDLINYLRDLGVCAYHPEDRLVSSSLVPPLLAGGFQVNVYTVNDPQRKKELQSIGVTAVFSDFL